MQRHSIAVLGLGVAALIMSPRPCVTQVTVVNVVPAKNSGENSGNPEPNLAIRDASLEALAVTAHLPGKGWCVDHTLNGLFASTNGGLTWTLVCAVFPKAPPTAKPGDFTTRFSGNGGWLYVSGLLPGGVPSLVASPNMLSGSAFTDLLGGTNPSVGSVDQPQLRTVPASTSASGVAEIDGGYVDVNGDGTVDCYRGRFLGSTTPPPIALKSRCTALRNRPERPWATRVAIHSSGVTYVAVLEVKTGDDAITRSDVVVLRGEPFNTSSSGLDALKEPGPTSSNICDPSDGQIGVRVVRCVPLAWDPTLNSSFGFEVRRGSLAVAVHPTQWKTVYVAWADSSVSGLMQTVHIRKSTDGGETWDTTDLFSRSNATNPSLAVDATGRLGFLSQQYVNMIPSAGGRWHTILRIFPTAGEAQDILLADTPAVDPSPDPTTPYQGDYTDVVAVGSTFLGVFSARNDPADVRFPYGATYNRYCSGAKLRKTASGGGVVKASVDPFFFRVGPGPTGPTVSGTGLSC